MVDHHRMNTGAQTSATMRVRPGSHSFRVIARNRYGARSSRHRAFRAADTTLECDVQAFRPLRRRGFLVKSESFVKCKGAPEVASVVLRTCIYRAPVGKTGRDYGYQQVGKCKTREFDGLRLLQRNRVPREEHCARGTTGRYVTKAFGSLFDPYRQSDGRRFVTKTATSRVITCRR